MADPIQITIPGRKVELLQGVLANYKADAIAAIDKHLEDINDQAAIDQLNQERARIEALTVPKLIRLMIREWAHLYTSNRVKAVRQPEIMDAAKQQVKQEIRDCIRDIEDL